MHFLQSINTNLHKMKPERLAVKSNMDDEEMLLLRGKNICDEWPTMCVQCSPSELITLLLSPVNVKEGSRIIARIVCECVTAETESPS